MKTKSLHAKKILGIVLGIVSFIALAVAGISCGSEEATVTEVQMLLPADKTEYLVGEKFDPSGLTFVAIYSDGTRKPVTEFTWDKTGELTKEDTTITITCEGKTFTQAITVVTHAEQIVLTLANGVDTCNLHGDGHISLIGGAGGNSVDPNETYWSWDGETLEIWMLTYVPNPAGTGNPVKDPSGLRHKMDLRYDDMGNLEFTYVLRSRWTANYAIPARDWQEVLTADARYPVAGSEVPAPTQEEIALAENGYGA